MCSLPCNLESFSFVECKDYIQYIEIGKGISTDTRCSWKLWPYIFGRCLRSEKASRWKSKAGGPSRFGSWDVVRMLDCILWFQRQAWPIWKLHDSLCDISSLWAFHINRSFGRYAVENEGATATPGGRDLHFAHPTIIPGRAGMKIPVDLSLGIVAWCCLSLFEDDVSSRDLLPDQMMLQISSIPVTICPLVVIPSFTSNPCNDFKIWDDHIQNIELSWRKCSRWRWGSQPGTAFVLRSRNSWRITPWSESITGSGSRHINWWCQWRKSCCYSEMFLGIFSDNLLGFTGHSVHQ